jgi:hypothetical protein
VLTCSDGAPCAHAVVAVDGDAKEVTPDKPLEFRAHRATVRIDVQAKDYEDYTTYVPVAPNGVVTLRAALHRLPNLRVCISSGGAFGGYENVYVYDGDERLGECSMDMAHKELPACAMSISSDKPHTGLRIHLAGPVTADLPPIAMSHQGITDVNVSLHKPRASDWWWIIPAAFTAATAGVIYAGAKSGGSSGDTMLAVGGGLTAIDLLGGGLMLSHYFAPKTEANVTVSPQGVQPPVESVTATVAANRPARTGPTAAIGPAGLVLRW